MSPIQPDAGPLAGVRVLDFTQVIAGPYGSSLLAQAGATVIKVESLIGESGRNLATGYFGWNRGKRAISIDLQTGPGREIFHRLAASADVIVENYRPGVVQRLGIDYETVAAFNPRIVYLSITAFGHTGPYSHRPGFDPLLQAMTGIERAQGGPHNPPVFLRIAITDLTTGLLHAASVSFALYRREQTGRGQHIRMSLMRSGIFINGDAFTRYDGRPARLLTDAGQHGLGPLDRMYRTADGWLFLLVEEDPARWQRLTAMPAFAHLAAAPAFETITARVQHADDLARELEHAFSSQTTGAWLEALGRAEVPCAPVVEGYGLRFFEDVQPMVNAYVVAGEHPDWGYMEQPGNYVGYSMTPTSQQGHAPPNLGQHTDEVLAEAGYTPAEISALRQARIVG